MKSVELLTHAQTGTPEFGEELTAEDIELLLSEGDEPESEHADDDREVVKVVDLRNRPRSAEKQGGMDLVRIYLDEIGKIPLLSAEEEVELAKEIEAGLFAEHLINPNSTDYKSNFKKLSKFKIEELRAVAIKGREAKAKFIESNLRLVASVAKKRGGMEFMDRMAIGVEGMMTAVEKFDYTKGYKFSTYGMWWIRQAMQRGTAKEGRNIRLPSHIAEKLNTLNNVQRQLTNELEREPTPQELADEMDLPLARVLYLLAVSSPIVSIYSSVSEDTELEELISDRTLPPVETEALHPIYHAELRERVEDVLDNMPEEDRIIIQKRFGLGEYEVTHQRQVAKEQSISVGAVRRAERRLIAWLRHPANDHALYSALEDADEPGWKNEAACKDTGDRMYPGIKEEEAAAAEEICHGIGCQAMKACLFAAIEQEVGTNVVAGVRGGLTSEQRATHIRRIRIGRGLVRVATKKPADE